MALLKSIESPSGAVAAYWVATEAAMSLRARVVDVTVRGWVDEAAFLAGKQPLDQRRFTFRGPQLDLLPGGAELEISGMVEMLAAMTPEFAPAIEQPPEQDAAP